MFDDVIDVLYAWAADRTLSRRKLAFLRTVHRQTIESGGIYQPPIADSFLCEELDLPHGSTVPVVVAELLDHLDPVAPGQISRATELQELIS